MLKTSIYTPCSKWKVLALVLIPGFRDWEERLGTFVSEHLNINRMKLEKDPKIREFESSLLDGIKTPSIQD